MRRTLLVASLVFCFLLSPAMAQDWAEKMFEVKVHDFGDVARGAKAEFKFPLKNLYVEDVHIASVRSSCGCTSPKIEKETLKSLETGAIVAKINTDRFLGRKGATLTVTIDKPFYAQVQLQDRVYIRSDVVFQPGSVQLGSVDYGTAAQRTVHIAYAGRSGWKIVAVESPNPHLQGEVVQQRRYGNRVRYDLTVRLDQDAPAGYLYEQIILKTNDRNRTQVPLLVEGRIQPGIVVSPSSLFMGTVKPGQQVTKQLVVRGKTPFRILSVTCADERFQFHLSQAQEPKTLHLVPVTFSGGESSGKVAGTIRIETDLDSTAPELAAYAVVNP